MLKHLKSSEGWDEKRLGAKGFTLIELLVVIVILGILAAVVVFAVGGITDKGKASACKTEVRTLHTAVESYYAQEGSYPADAGTLKTKKFIATSPTYVTYSGGSGNTVGTYGWSSAAPTECTNASPAIDLGN